MDPLRTAEANDALAIINGDHADPFGYLGLHRIGTDYIVRAFLPRATQVRVVEAGRRRVLADLERVHDAGLFVGRLEAGRERPAYRLLVNWDGDSAEIEDPYRFPPWLGDLDVHLLSEGNHLDAYEKLGAHPTRLDGVDGVAFAVWAPNARRVSVIGGFNNWDGRRHPMRLRHDCGVWELFIPGLAAGELYKYEVKGRDGTLLPPKADPFAFRAERPPNTASIVHARRDFDWRDADWLKARERASDRAAPIAIYEVHLGSWRRKPEEGNRYLTYRELAAELVPYVCELGFTHVEFLPVSEYPFDGSWGYQPTGLFAPTSRFGTPDDFSTLVDACHRAGIGVILDWVPGHFPTDPHGLGNFDGTHLYEHADPRLGVHRDWDTLIYNYGRREVSNFLLSNALFWLRRYHVDGLRVDAVASMLYLDYSRGSGEWLPNKYGGRENLDAVAFLRRLNELAYGQAPGTLTVAEESTAWPMVSRPTYLGGLGFGYKWNMGWMHDTLEYFKKDPIYRRYSHDQLTFGLLYAFSENFILPLSHDEVVHGKGSLLGKMPGDRALKFANLRAYLSFMYAHPGKKLLFMGGEFAQDREWNHDQSLDWHLLADPPHAGIQRLVRDLNRVYREVPALHARDTESDGFEWIDCNDRDGNIISFLRRGATQDAIAICVCNFAPVAHRGYRIGVPRSGPYRELLNSDAACYGGSDLGNAGILMAEPVPCHGRPYSLNLTLPPLAVLLLRPQVDG